jgi:alkylation response protein AidB-like acyl-CoA dehydrogenase
MTRVGSPWPLRAALEAVDPAVLAGGAGPRARLLRDLARDGLANLPPSGGGATLDRWRALAAVAGHDLALAKLYEGHVDALAMLAEAGEPETGLDTVWGMWAAESPDARVTFDVSADGRCTLSGTKAWCSGARHVDAGLLTAWHPDGRGPFLARVRLAQPGVSFIESNWQAVGMAASESVDVRFDRAEAALLGVERYYLERSGFWQGGIGIAACWHGGACAIAEALRGQVERAGANAGWHRLLGLGAIDHVLAANAALLREAARWVDAHPRDDARGWALRTRANADAACALVLHHATRALGATPLCRDAGFARCAADLPVFVRQCHGDRDLAALGQHVAQGRTTSWRL